MKERTVTDQLAGHDSPASPRCVGIGDQQFRVVSSTGATLGRFEHLLDALALFNGDELAAAVSLGRYVVTRREGGAA